MKIIQVNPGLLPIPPNGWGAVEKIIWEYKLELVKQGHEVEIKYVNEVEKESGVVVHAHMWNHGLELARRGIPYVYTCHDHHAFVSGKESEVYRNNLEAIKKAKLALVPAEYLVEYFEGVPKYFPHGVDLGVYKPGSTPKEFRVLCVGNNGLIYDEVFDRKGFGFAIKAATELGIGVTIAGPSRNNKLFFEENSGWLSLGDVEVVYDLSDSELVELYQRSSVLIHASMAEAGHPPLTLLEAAGCGLPVVSTGCNGGLYCSVVGRNVEEVKKKVLSVKVNYATEQKKTLESVSKFAWPLVVGDLAKLYGRVQKPTMRESALTVYGKVSRLEKKNGVKIGFIDGPSAEVVGVYKGKYKVSFIDGQTKEEVYSTEIENNMWAKASRCWFTKWVIRVSKGSEVIHEHEFNAKGKRVLVAFESKAIGDTIAWMPYVEEFRKIHECEVLLSTFHNGLFELVYPEIEFINPGSVADRIYALYRVGVFYGEGSVNFDKHKVDFKPVPLQQICSDVLGLEYKEIKPEIVKPLEYKVDKPYVCIGNHSSAQAKYWNNPTGWQEVVDFVKSLGYEVYGLSKEPREYMGNVDPKGIVKIQDKSLEEISSILLGSSGFVGVSSGLTWLAWALGVPSVLISGFSEAGLEMQGVSRIINTKVCHGCWSRHLFDKGKWGWCPDGKDFECSKNIDSKEVVSALGSLLSNKI